MRVLYPLCACAAVYVLCACAAVYVVGLLMGISVHDCLLLFIPFTCKNSLVKTYLIVSHLLVKTEIICDIWKLSLVLLLKDSSVCVNALRVILLLYVHSYIMV